MPPKSGVKYVDIDLSSVDAYWREIVMPSVQAFRGVSSARTVLQAAHAVWHLHEWVWHERNPGTDASGKRFDHFRRRILTTCPELGWLRDITDAGKHRGLNRSTVGVKAAEKHMLERGDDGSGTTSSPIPVHIVALTDGSRHHVDAVLQAAIKFWLSELKNSNLPSPFA